MAYQVVEFRPTPNPDALKCMVEPQVRALPEGAESKRPRAYRTKDEAAVDPLALALFGIEGVTNVLIHEQWITVNKDKASSWSKVKPQIEKVLREAP
jgi:hypothetical protein